MRHLVLTSAGEAIGTPAARFRADGRGGTELISFPANWWMPPYSAALSPPFGLKGIARWAVSLPARRAAASHTPLAKARVDFAEHRRIVDRRQEWVVFAVGDPAHRAAQDLARPGLRQAGDGQRGLEAGDRADAIANELDDFAVAGYDVVRVRQHQTGNCGAPLCQF
jgi:hypothetical protein